MNQYRSPTFEDVYAFLEREFKIQYREKAEMFKRPLAERVEEGVAIAGLRVERTYPNPMGRGTITVFKTDQDNNSIFRPGDYFYCHLQNRNIELDEAMKELKRVNFRDRKLFELSPDRRTIHLPGKFASTDEPWCISELPNERFPLTTYPCLMGGVLESSCETGEKVRRWLGLGGQVATFSSGLSDLGPDFLTETQKRALHRAIQDEIALIQGPPGTGKTFLIAEIVEQLMILNPESRILVCCFSHTAIDNVLRAVFKRNPEIPRFRIGRRQEDPPLPEGTNAEAEDLWDTVPGVTGMTVFKAAKPWAKELGKQYKSYGDKLGGWQHLDESGRIDAIRNSWENAELDHGETYFDVVIMDEASQMTIPNALMAMVHGSRCILVGDEKQLPPVAQVEPPFAPSIFDHMLGANIQGEGIYEPDRPVMLDVTHRMNEEICASPSRLFYGGDLYPRDDIRTQRLVYPDALRPDDARPEWLCRALDPEQPVLFISIDHDTGDESNEEEADVVSAIVAEMLGTGLTHDEGIAVVCAHRKQNSLVRKKTKEAIERLFPDRADEIDINNLVSETVERIQGQERDVIIVSLIGSDPNHFMHQWTFSHCPRRFNVSITRPKSNLVVVGSPRFFHFVPDTGHGETLDRLKGVTAIKRWYLDRLDGSEISEYCVATS